MRKPRSKSATLLLIVILAFMSVTGYPQTENEEGEPVKILFIGSSYFNYVDMPGIFRNISETAGREVYIGRNTVPGYYLSDHVLSIYTDSLIYSNDWDYVILQGSPTMAYPDYYTEHPVYPAVVALWEKIKDNCPESIVIYTLPWAFEDGMTWLGWSDTYEDMQIKIFDETIDYSKRIDIMISPVGWAWYKVLKELNYPLHYLHVSDWSHPSLKGSYLMACVIYSTIFLDSSSGNSYYAGLTMTEAATFQEIGSSTVLENTVLWKITDPVAGISVVNDESVIILHQNYPNPFSEETAIKFEIFQPGMVRIKLLDYTGNTCSILVEEFKIPGKYSMTINAMNLSPGMYFCLLETDSSVKLIKMVKSAGFY